MLHHLDYIKANTSRYFFETKRVYLPFKYNWGWGIKSVDLAFPTCYFLGSYPNYWNTQNRRIVFAHDLMTSECYSIGNKPTMMAEYLPDVDRDVLNDTVNLFGVNNILDYFHPERIPQIKPELDLTARIEEEERRRKLRLEIEKALSDLTLFYDPFDIEQFMLQKPLLDARTKTFKDCIARTWPKKPYTPKPKTPTATPPITSTPMSEIQKPTPMMVPAPPPKLSLVFNYGVKPDTPANVLQLTIWLEETL